MHPRSNPLHTKLDFKSLSWLAGLLEGEGWFGFSKAYKSRYGFLIIALQMTDADVVERAAKILNRPVKLRAPFRSGGRKPVWSCIVAGSSAAGWMMTLYPLMGQRRGEQIRSSLTKWRASPGHSAKTKVRLSGLGVAGKVCRGCKRHLTLESFRKNSDGCLLGRDSRCRVCRSKVHQREYLVPIAQPSLL